MHLVDYRVMQMDEFIVEAINIGKLDKLRIGHDAKNPGSGWFLDKVVVWEVENPENKATFECHR